MAERPSRASTPSGGAPGPAGRDRGSVTGNRPGAPASEAGEGLGFIEVKEEALETYSAESGAIINLAHQILIQAVGEGASDIHIEPFEKQLQVRYRIDGALYRRTRLPPELKNALIARLKIMAKLNPAERRTPQDGRIKMRAGQTREIDFRVSCLPTTFGESLVLRILDRSRLILDLGKLGLTRLNQDKLRSAIHRASGLILVTGPAGSGKTVTLYSCLSLRNTDEVKILTAEDPVEFSFPGLGQVNVAQEAGLTFAKALKAFLRQDPDICMIGEIRDLETAEIAVEAALAGHLVLAALPAGDASAAIARLLDMGVPPFKLAAALVLCSAQRLLRRICPNCQTAAEPKPVSQLIEAGFDRGQAGLVQLYEGRGCPECRGSGYQGRLGVFEIMEMTDFLAEALAAKLPESHFRQIALKAGMSTLRQDGLLKAAQGLTTLAQVLEKTGPPRESPPPGPSLPDEALLEVPLPKIPASSVSRRAHLPKASFSGQSAPPFPPPDQTLAPTPRGLAEADPAALRLVAPLAPKARELKSA